MTEVLERPAAGPPAVAASPAIEPAIQPEVHSTTLGRWVIGGCREMVPAGILDAPGSGLSGRLDSSRIRLLKLTDEQSDMFDRICEGSVPEALQERKAGTAEAEGSSWKMWLGEIAGDAQLLEYLVWNVGSIEEQQNDPGVREEVAAQREMYKENLRRGMDEGWLHGAADAAIGKVDGVKVYIGDVFGTALEEIMAYCTRGNGEVIFGSATSIPAALPYKGTRLKVKLTAQHEFNHAVLGWLGPRWLNEAVTEHIAHVLQHDGRLERVDPDKRLNYGPPIYPGERRLLNHMLNAGSEPVPVELATLAYSEEPTGERTALHAFREAVNRAWAHAVPQGEQALGRLDLYVSRTERLNILGGLSYKKATAQAMTDVYSDIKADPEAVFRGVSPSEK